MIQCLCVAVICYYGTSCTCVKYNIRLCQFNNAFLTRALFYKKKIECTEINFDLCQIASLGKLPKSFQKGIHNRNHWVE